MSGFTADLYTVEFDGSGYKSILDSNLSQNTEAAARSWLRTLLTIIPTWSRASRATFEALANGVGFHVTYGPVIADKNREALGRANSKGGLDIVKGEKYIFFYETDLRYLAFNEANKANFGDPGVFSRNGIPNTPYNFLDAGKQDFLSFASTIKLPSPLAFISSRRI